MCPSDSPAASSPRSSSSGRTNSDRSTSNHSGPTHIDHATGEVVELLQTMIRHACVNDGRPESGHERPNAELLGAHLGVEHVITAPTDLPDRASMVARIEGTDPNAPTLLLLGHTDVVPVEADSWTHDPFGAELIDGEIWGRGAVDMLNQTAAMAAAFRRIAHGRRRPKGTLIFAAVADEEAGGTHGIGHLLDTQPDLVLADAVLTEAGGTVTETSKGPRLSAMVGEKGMSLAIVTVRGRPGHGSLPLLADNALIIAGEVVRRISTARPPTQIQPVWRQWVTETVEDPELRSLLLDEHRLWDQLPHLPAEHRATAHACTHTTYSPTMIEGSAKSNVIPGQVTLTVDVRLGGDETDRDAELFLSQILADLPVDIAMVSLSQTTLSPPGTPIWHSLERAIQVAYPDGALVPSLFSGGTDGRYFRQRGIPTYGFGVLSRAMPPARYWSLFHGHDERIDLESLRLSTEAWERVAWDYLDGAH